jgi:hypothetical protein
MDENIKVQVFYSLERARSAGYEPIGEPVRYTTDTSKFDLGKSEEELIKLAQESFAAMDYDTILLLRYCGPDNKCVDDGFWVQPAKGMDKERRYQLTRGFALAPHVDPKTCTY